ncbi:MAG TPA: heavy-metal-associated domain-containing protein [Accumulibacter sp.]|nr:heavy-metal-associated domain-containing protein [Accumulibacter sp.]HMW17773.1 heavy-metal-associated domain-containing protein [Accumulibacter sp.]HMX22279.1 heavy-metal-associated domain-containing protein [Accumulibacter sp.]HMY05638.1 heavy-metal-associated domain-containing protein [Accumulibacter sp.]HNC17895.1 heavy-metal-associated domain-containing protein [Accumulibacter sp.]
MEKLVLGVAGMSCQSCVKSVTTVLTELPGVAEVDVSLPAAQATIVYDPSQTSVADLQQVIADAGFDPV